MRRVIVPCSGGCGRKRDLTKEATATKQLGFRRRPKYLCAECYRKEKASKRNKGEPDV